MSNDELTSEIITEIGAILFEQGMIQGGRSMIYSEVKPGMYSVSNFVDRGDAVYYVRDPVAIEKAILELWNAAEQDKKWRSACYKLTGEEFQVTFDYGEDWDAEEVSFDRRQRVLEDFYPDRKIIYPKIDLKGLPESLSA